MGAIKCLSDHEGYQMFDLWWGYQMFEWSSGLPNVCVMVRDVKCLNDSGPIKCLCSGGGYQVFEWSWGLANEG